MEGEHQKQLSFERFYVNRTVGQSENPGQRQKQITIKRKQAKNIFAELKKGSLTTSQLREMAAQYNARIKELRDWLRQFGQTIDRIPVKGGNNRYILRAFAGSRYQAELMKKQVKVISSK